MKEIKLTQGKFAIVDDEDFEFLNQFRWNTRKDDGDNYYAQRHLKNKEGKKTVQLMHRMIMKADNPKILIDHKNGNGLDNRKENLRFASINQNRFNRKAQSNNTSGFKGVFWDKRSNKWFAQIKKYGKVKYLGSFSNKIEAARAYNNAAIVLFGEFAWLNELREVTPNV